MLGISTSLFTIACSRNHYPADNFKNLPNDVVLKWNEVAYEGFGGVTYQHSLMASRVNAMVHIAMHDALNAVYPKYAQYAYTGKDSGADPIAAAATAAHAVLLHEIPGRKNFLDSAPMSPSTGTEVRVPSKETITMCASASPSVSCPAYCTSSTVCCAPCARSAPRRSLAWR